MHEQRLGGVADAHPLALGVDGDRFGHVEVGGLVDVDVAVAREVLENGHSRLGADASDQGLAASGNGDVDEVVHREKLAHSLTVGDVDELHGIDG